MAAIGVPYGMTSHVAFGVRRRETPQLTAHEYRFGTTRVRILVSDRVTTGTTGPGSFVATALAGDSLDLVTEDGRSVEKRRSDPDQAREALCCYLETRFGPRRRLGPRQS